MTQKIPRVGWLLFAIVCLLILPGVANAADPVRSGSQAAETAWDVWVTNGPLWGALVLVMVGLRTFLDRQHWLLQGRLLAGLTGLAAVITSVLEWKFGGSPAAGIATALMGAIALITHPVPAPADPQVARAAGPGTLGLLVVVGIAGALASSSSACSASARQREADFAATGGSALLNCEGPALAGTFVSMLPIAGDAVLSWISGDGKHIDKAKLKAAMAPLTDKDAQLKCALTTALAIATTPAPQQPGAPAAAGLEVDAIAVRAAFAGLRAELGWAPVSTRAGVL